MEPGVLPPGCLGPGCFGKVPGRGDFVARRVPVVLQSAWETWLAGLVVAAREDLAAAWPDDWLTAPLWHFALGRVLAPPSGAAGVLVASVDRVGRCYPFTLIGLTAAGRTPPNEWAGNAEALTLRALEDDFDPEVMDAALLSLGPPPAFSAPGQQSGRRALALDGDWPADPGWRSPGADQSVWFCRGSARMQAIQVCCASLPDRDTSARLITGDFGA
jgi:type VI secretion system protein ImpM